MTIERGSFGLAVGVHCLGASPSLLSGTSSFAPIPLPIHPTQIFYCECNQEGCNQYRYIAALDCTQRKHQRGNRCQCTYHEEYKIGYAEPRFIIHARMIAWASTTGLRRRIAINSPAADTLTVISTTAASTTTPAVIISTRTTGFFISGLF